jgi:hypothetical protein
LITIGPFSRVFTMTSGILHYLGAADELAGTRSRPVLMAMDCGPGVSARRVMN